MELRSLWRNEKALHGHTASRRLGAPEARGGVCATKAVTASWRLPAGQVRALTAQVSDLGRRRRAVDPLGRRSGRAARVPE